LASELESRGNGSLEQRTVTICSGVDFVNVTYNNFVARNEETANASVSNMCQKVVLFHFFLLVLLILPLPLPLPLLLLLILRL